MEKFIEIAQGLWYETLTGLPWSSKKPGGSKKCVYNAPLKKLNCKNSKGYRATRLDGKMVLWHRIVFQFFHGSIPKYMEIDHRNNKRDDCRIENLQLLSANENKRCQLKHKANTSGFPGVSWNKKCRKWRAKIVVDRVHKCLGYFNKPEEAYKAYIAAKIEFHGKESIRNHKNYKDQSNLTHGI